MEAKPVLGRETTCGAIPVWERHPRQLEALLSWRGRPSWVEPSVSRMTGVTPSGAWMYLGGLGVRTGRNHGWSGSSLRTGEQKRERDHPTGACGKREQTPEGGADTHTRTRTARRLGDMRGRDGLTVSRHTSVISIPKTGAEIGPVRAVTRQQRIPRVVTTHWVRRARSPRWCESGETIGQAVYLREELDTSHGE